MSAGTRAFAGVSALGDGGLGLALAPALTPSGVVERHGLFHGLATEPVVLARGLLALADVTSVSYTHLDVDKRQTRQGRPSLEQGPERRVTGPPPG